MACDCHFEAKDAEETRVLRILFLINFIMFACEVVVGIIADSTGVLVAMTGSRWPDITIGSLITLVVLWGGISILRDAATEKLKSPCADRC